MCAAAPAIEIEFAGKARMRIPTSIPTGLAAAVVNHAAGGNDTSSLGGAGVAAGRLTDMRRGMNSLAFHYHT